jgi:hypothetical protein
MTRPTTQKTLCEAVRAAKRDRSYRRMAQDLGLTGTDFAMLARVAHGMKVSRATELRLGRALGVYPPARKVVRWCVPDDLDARARALGVSRREVVEAGLQALENV